MLLKSPRFSWMKLFGCMVCLKQVSDCDVRFMSYFWKPFLAHDGHQTLVSFAWVIYCDVWSVSISSPGILFYLLLNLLKTILSTGLGMNPSEVVYVDKPRAPIDLGPMEISHRPLESANEFMLHIHQLHAEINHRINRNNEQ